MKNIEILKLLEAQRDELYRTLKETSISGLYKKMYDDLNTGTLVFLNGEKRQMLKELKDRSKDTSSDYLMKDKLAEYLTLDNLNLIRYFQKEWISVLNNIEHSQKQNEIQALFVEYDFYYHYSGDITCYGQQDYPLVKEPRYIADEIDESEQILFMERGINFEPAWLDCEAFDEFEELELEFKLQQLFQLHSRVLLHIALDWLSEAGRLKMFTNRPFSFYINEHDCEVMTLYRIGAS